MERVVGPGAGALVRDDVEMLVVHSGAAFNFVRAETPQQPSCFQLRRDQTLVSQKIDRVARDEQPRPSVLPVGAELPPDFPVGRVDRIQRSVVRGTQRVTWPRWPAGTCSRDQDESLGGYRLADIEVVEGSHPLCFSQFRVNGVEEAFL